MKWPQFMAWANTGDPVSLARFASSKGGRATITPTHLTTAGDTTNQNAYTTASISLGSNELGLLWMVQTATAASGVSSFAGTFAGTWTQVNTFAVAATRITCYRSLSSTPQSGTVTLNFAAGDTTTGIAWSISKFANVNTSGSNGAGAIVQSNAQAGGAGTTTTVSLVSALENANNVMAYGLTHAANEQLLTYGTGMTKLGDTSFATPNTGLGTAGGRNVTSCAPTWTTSLIPRWVAVEIKAA